MKHTIILLLSLLLSSIWFTTQAVSDYSSDFEDSTKDAEWNLNPAVKYAGTAKWVIGSATNNGGSRSLYVSTDGGISTNYSASACCIYAVLPLTLDKGEYQFSFDWKAKGGTNNDKLQVLWVPNRDEFGDSLKIFCSETSGISQSLSPYLLAVNKFQDDYLNGATSWQQCHITFTINPEGVQTQTGRIVFAWMNGPSDEQIPPAACIDNIDLQYAPKCSQPDSVTITSSQRKTYVSWTSDASSFYVKYHSVVDNQWQSLQTTDTFCTIEGLSEGMCDFYIMGYCDDGSHTFAAQKTVLIYYPEEHCVDYLSLTDANCFYGEGFKKTSDKVNYTQGKVDDGYLAETSRHTLHIDRQETDARTNNKLKTIYKNDIASVRLGNWLAGNQTERVRIPFHVDASVNPVMMLHYAVVLENPGHDIGNPENRQDPRFQLTIFDEQGKELGDCARADFTSSQGGDGWNECTYIKPGSASGSTVVWRDWTTIGVNLADYDGQTLTVQLTTFDCALSAHFGYAYFSLECSDGKLDGINCGDTPTDYFEAPDGFLYRWYKKYDPTMSVICRTQRMDVSNTDTTTYAVDMMFPKDTTCFFTLNASATPRYPVAEPKMSWEPINCENRICLTHNSHVVLVDRLSGEKRISDEAPTYNVWTLPDGSTTRQDTIWYTFDNEGANAEVTLRTVFQSCDSVVTIKFNVPAIGDTTTTVKAFGCKGTPFEFNHHYYTETGIYIDSMLTFAGCDSIVILDLTMVEKMYDTLSVTIMDDEQYIFDKDTLNKTGVYTKTFTSIYGCDSIVTLYLYVYEQLRIASDSVITSCAGSGIGQLSYTILSGHTDAYSLSVDLGGKTIFNIPEQPLIASPIIFEIPERIQPDIYTYTLTMPDTMLGDIKAQGKLIVNYPDTIITQRWNDVLAIRNTDYNGGFKLIAYQWYKNGQIMPGDTLSYIYKPEGLDVNAEYSALVTRAGDNLQLMICPPEVKKIDKTKTPDIPTLIPTNHPLPIRMGTRTATNGTATWTSPTGIVISRQTYIEGNGVVSPTQAGIYLLTLTSSEDGNRSTYTIVVQ